MADLSLGGNAGGSGDDSADVDVASDAGGVAASAAGGGAGDGRRRFHGMGVIVTGAAHGIGSAIAEAFVAEGGTVALLDVDAASGAEVARTLNSAAGGERARAFECNMADEANVERVTGEAVAWAGHLDVLVNNAAAFVFGTVEETTGEMWGAPRSAVPHLVPPASPLPVASPDRVLSVNVKGYAFAMKHCVPHLRARGAGAIVNVSSISAFVAQPGFVPYAATKAAILQITRNVALDVGRDNIRVNACVACAPRVTASTQLTASVPIPRCVQRVPRAHTDPRNGAARGVAGQEPRRPGGRDGRAAHPEAHGQAGRGGCGGAVPRLARRRLRHGLAPYGGRRLLRAVGEAYTYTAAATARAQREIDRELRARRCNENNLQYRHSNARKWGDRAWVGHRAPRGAEAKSKSEPRIGYRV